MQKTQPTLIDTIDSKYIALYNEIQNGRPRWLTISPPMSDADVNCLDSLYMTSIIKILGTTSKVLGVREFSSNMRLHYHICYDSRHHKAEYQFINTLRKDTASMICNLKGPPDKGIQYLFKEIEESGEILGHKSVFTQDTLIDMKNKLKIKNKKERQLQKVNKLDEGLPSWMLGSDDTDSE